MEKFILVIMLLATVTSADVSVQCSEQFIAQHGSSFPVSGSCKKYLVCSGGQLVEQTCQDGLHFNVELNRCALEIDANCSSARRQIIDNGKCNNSDEISFHPDPHHCARYVLCLGNITIPRLCAAGLLFNAETGQCDFPQNVFCDVTCPRDGNELVFIGDSSGRDCARYSICLNGVPRPAKCSSMLYFDLVTGTCMQPEDASCRIRDVVCTDRDELLEDSKSCASYFQCEGGLPHYRECDEGKIFSGGRCVPGNCGDREDTTVDGTSTVSSTAVVTKTSTSHTTSELTTDHSSTTVALETSTTTATATSDVATTDVTVSTIVTSEATNNPSTSTEIATSPVPITSTTTQSDTPSTITTSTTTPTDTTPIDASSTTESSISTVSSPPESTSMTSVITPESTTPVQTGSPSTDTSTQGSSTTASSTISPESSTLATPITTTDSGTPTQTGSPPTTESTSSTPTEPPPSTDPAIVCHGTGIALLPHPYRCDQYFVCIFGSGSLATCDGGLLFDRESMVCVPAGRVTCAIN